ncbi:anti-sigma factor family protein [Thalassospira mesophila]|uniref:Membrane protein n=1 Tax=Thalassospira mesophila TaxID=1293891 RepID=A0A1Y2KXB7_9PROT|nr:anti-sigma factor [Thalassospira mesophila]OSQ36979.1 membrane protein [Thalassospira mesophila]
MSDRPITEDDLHAYVDLALDAARHGEVERYLARHEDVAARVAGYRKDRDLLRNAFARVAEEPVPSRLNVDRMIAQRHASRYQVWQLAVAAMVMLVVGVAGGWSLHGQWGPPVAVVAAGPASGIAALASEAADSYAVYAPDSFRPVEMRADDSADFVRWASQRLSHPVRVPDLAPAGYRFMGGRIIATAHGPAAMLMYDDDKGVRLVMLTRPMEIDQNAPMTSSHRGDLGGYSWADKGLGYSVVAPLGDGLLHPLADEIRRQLGRDI